MDNDPLITVLYSQIEFLRKELDSKDTIIKLLLNDHNNNNNIKVQINDDSNKHITNDRNAINNKPNHSNYRHSFNKKKTTLMKQLIVITHQAKKTRQIQKISAMIVSRRSLTKRIQDQVI